MDSQRTVSKRRLNIDFVMSVGTLLISAVACATARHSIAGARKNNKRVAIHLINKR
jgi:hypothetical protein